MGTLLITLRLCEKETITLGITDGLIQGSKAGFFFPAHSPGWVLCKNPKQACIVTWDIGVKAEESEAG